MLKKRSISNNHNGFTLVELIVVLVIMGILLSISAASLIAFQDTSRQLKKDEAAQTIFFAAQNKLTEMEGNGQIEELRESLKYEDGNYSINDYVPVFSTISGNVFNPWFSNYITRTCLTTNDDKTEEGRSRLAGTQAMLMTDHDIWGTYDQNILISLRAKAGDYKLYTDDPMLVELQTRILFELIEDTVADQEILNGAICLEIAPEEGQVFSALYSDTAYEFYYGHADNGSEGRVDISRRHEGARASKAIGYYGVESLTHVTYVPVTGLDLGELSYDNGDVLSYHLSVKQIEGIDLGVLDYTITVYDTATSRKALEFTVSGADVKEKQSDIMDNMVECPTTRYDAFGNSKNLGSYRIPIYKERIGDEETDGLGFILDAADISAMTILLDANGGDEGYKIRNGTGTDGTFCRSLSFFRFGTWTEIEGAWTDNIFVEITVNSDDLDEPAVARSKSTSPYFADASTERKRPQDNSGANNYKTYGITNCRHFYNMRYYEDLEITTLGLPNAHANELSKFRIDFVLRNDLDWGEFAKTSLYASSSNYYSEKIQDHKAIGFDFPSFKELRVYDYLIGLDETAAQTEVDRLAAEYPNYGFADTDALTKALESDWTVHDPAFAAEETSKTITIPDLIEDNLQLSHSISNLSISMKSNMVYGLYRDYAPERDKPTGLFLENNGVVKYFAMDQSKIVGSNKVGAICGANAGTILYSGTLSTRTDEHPDPTIVQGIKYVGGVFGYQASIGSLDYTKAYRDLYISYLTNHARVLGTEYVGGITSCVINGNDTRINDTGSDTEDYANIRHIVIRYCENYGQVRGVYAPLAEGKLDPTNEAAMMQYKQSVRYIGGIVGYMNNVGNVYANKKNNPLWSTTEADIRSWILSCYSYPVYDETYDQEVYEKLDKLNQIKHYQLAEPEQEDLLQLMKDYNVGYCVGGIVGYANQVRIRGCGIRIKDNKVVDAYGNEIKGGYVFGDQYVGGIIGFNDSYLQESCTNASSVVGNYYVGGIVGINIHANSQLTEEERKELVTADLLGTTVIDGKANRAQTGSSVNKGSVYGLYDYVGGIAGYNAGHIKGSCTIPLDTDLPVISGRNYVGGITGRNEGVALSGGMNITAAVNGENYVGGLIGYIGPTDPVPIGGTHFMNGSVYANGSFAGGIAGIVMNPAIYDNSYRPQPIEITARYFAGGAFGGSIIRPVKNITTKIWVGVEKVTQLQMHGTAFVGGSIGCNIMGNMSDDMIIQAVSQLSAVDSMGDNYVNSIEGRSQEELVHLLWNMDSLETFGTCDYSFSMIQSANQDSVMVDSITPLVGTGYEGRLVYAAGVVGYNGNNTILNLSKMRSWNNFRTNIIQTTAINVPMKRYNAETHRIEDMLVPCSFTGNFVGCNTARSTISECVGYATFISEGTYRGGLCEINYGLINNPKTSVGSSTYLYQTNDENADYVGGVCGYNAGRIIAKDQGDGCVKGRSVLGIIAAENYGEIVIDRDSFSGFRVNGADNGSIAGTVVGRNLGTLTLNSGNGLKLGGGGYVTIGDCAGGLIGEQVGSIELSKIVNQLDGGANNYCVRSDNGVCGGLIGRLITLDGDEVLVNDCSFTGSKNIGGLIASGLIGDINLSGGSKVVIQNSTISRWVEAKGTDSIAAGFVARVSSTDDDPNSIVIIQNCAVKSEVKNSTDSMRSAGIVYDAGSRTMIDRCRNHGPKVGYGITATTARSITNCYDAALNGKDRFGCVEETSEAIFGNNYSMLYSPNNYSTVVTGEFAEDSSVFDGQVVMLHTMKEDGKNVFIAEYEIHDQETDEDHVVIARMPIQTTGDNPGAINDFHSYRNAYQLVDNAFMEYLATYSIDSGIH